MSKTAKDEAAAPYTLDGLTMSAALDPGEIKTIARAQAIIKRQWNNRDQALTSPTVTRQWLQVLLGAYEHEVFALVMLDNRNRVLAWREMFRGTVDGASVYPREVAKQALADNAAAVVLVHNHPSGVCEPSQADIRITRDLKQALALLDIRVIDHFIVGDELTSMAERGLV